MPYVPLGDSNGDDDPPVPPETAQKLAVHAALGPHLPPGCQFEAAEGLPVHILLDRAEGAQMLMLGNSRPKTVRARRPGRPIAPLGQIARACARRAMPVVVVRLAPYRPGQARRPCCGDRLNPGLTVPAGLPVSGVFGHASGPGQVGDS